MPFEKGQHKTGGRKPGSVNKTTLKVRKVIARVLEGVDIKMIFEGLEPREKLKVWLELVEYVTPKLARRDQDLEDRLAALEQLLNEKNNGQGRD